MEKNISSEEDLKYSLDHCKKEIIEEFILKSESTDGTVDVGGTNGVAIAKEAVFIKTEYENEDSLVATEDRGSNTKSANIKVEDLILKNTHLEIEKRSNISNNSTNIHLNQNMNDIDNKKINRNVGIFKDGMFTCKFCWRTFDESILLEDHLKTHEIKKVFICEVCKRKFAKKVQLRRHLVSHEGQKPFQCEICQKNFTTVYNLKGHLLTHRQDKPFNCEVCQKSFSVRRYMIAHQKTHFGEKSYICEVCNKSFTKRVYLTKHYATHTGKV